MKKAFRDLFELESFDIFYDETVIVKTKSNYSQSIKVCVFQDSELEPISDSIDSTCEGISIVARKQDWQFIAKLQRGDTISRPCINKNYRIQSIVNDDAMGMVIKARMV